MSSTRWIGGNFLFSAFVIVPAYANRLRHRPYWLTRGTQHIVLAGLAVQIVLIGAGFLLWALK